MTNITLNTPILGSENGHDNCLQLSKIIIDEKYRKHWNINCHDFVCLTKNGQLLSNTLYRVGGFTVDIKNDYFMLLKHVEARYEDSITKDKAQKNHLESQWCILNKNGVEKVNFEVFRNPYLVKDSCIYSMQGKYYNIETGEFYGNSCTLMQSKEFLFLDVDFNYSDEKMELGVKKINKKDGTWELFKK